MKKMFVSMITFAFLLAACNSDKKTETTDTGKMESSTESQEEKNKATALASVNALIDGDVDGTLKNVTADATDYGDGSMPAIKSLDSIKTSLQMWRASMSEYKADNLWALADGDQVAVFGDWTGTFKTDFMGMKVIGKSFKLKDVDLFKFNSDGKITEHRNIQSSAAMMSQLGIEMPK